MCIPGSTEQSIGQQAEHEKVQMGRGKIASGHMFLPDWTNWVDQVGV